MFWALVGHLTGRSAGPFEVNLSSINPFLPTAVPASHLLNTMQLAVSATDMNIANACAAGAEKGRKTCASHTS